MAYKMLFALALVVALCHGAQATDAVFDTPTVSCSAAGFAPSFNYDTGTTQENQVLSIVTTIGNGASGCIATNTATTGDVAIGISDFGIKTAIVTATGPEDIILYGAASADTPPVITPTCGGTLTHTTDENDPSHIEKISYEVSIKAVVTRTYRTVIERKTQYPFTLKCVMVRNVALDSNAPFLVDIALVNAADPVEIADTMGFTATLKFYDSTWVTPKDDSTTISVKNNAKLYMQVEKAADQSLFKYAVDECYASNDATGNYANDKDSFFKDKCHADKTVSFTMETDNKFRLEILSFSFPNPAHTTTIFFHCKLTVCLASTPLDNAPCKQETKDWCDGQTGGVDNNPNSNILERRRRSAEEGKYQHTTIHSTNAVILDQSEIFAPSCGNGFLYDRVLKECTGENLMEIKGIYLSEDVFNPAYANVTSQAFKRMAEEKEYQLWVLLQVTGRTAFIHGIKVIRARPGSVILDVVIKYAASVSAEEAFNQFKDALLTKPSVTRVMNILKIREDKIIEYVPIVTREKADTEKLILIVVVVVLFVVVFIAGVTLFKVKQVRQRSANNAQATGFDNKGIDA